MLICGGWVTFVVAMEEQPVASFTVSVYVPAVKPVNVLDACGVPPFS
ncbi:MAG: hypothetical protein K2Q24_16990 [Chitinophagaceae bacterium]|jgi:hypothetical protein|nr:hypothetical protein [Chitinophagaceae bacterium]